MSNVNVKKQYLKRTLRYLRNAFTNIGNDYMKESRENLKAKRDLTIPTKEDMAKVYSNFMKYNEKQKGFLRMTYDEMKELWTTAKKEAGAQFKRLGTDPDKLKKQEKDDTFDINDIPDFDDLGTESMEYSLQTSFEPTLESESIDPPNTYYLTEDFLGKVMLLFTSMLEHTGINDWASSSNSDIREIIKSSIANTPLEEQKIDSSVSVVTSMIERIRNCQPITQGEFCNKNVLVGTESTDVIIMRDTKELKAYVKNLIDSLNQEDKSTIVTIDNILHDILNAYNYLHPSDKACLIENNPLVRDLASVYNDSELAHDIFILFYFNIISEKSLNDINDRIKEFINLQ